MSEDGVRIRFATDEDRAAMQEIFNREVEHSTASWQWSPLSNEDWSAWFVEHTRDHHVLLVAEVGDPDLRQDDSRRDDSRQGDSRQGDNRRIDSHVVGFAGYGTFRTKDGYISTVEDSVFLEEGFRGQGLGTQLLTRLMEEARARGVHSMVAAVTSENEASIHLHTSVGFRQAGYLPQVGHKFGRWLDLVLLQAILDDRPAP